MLEDAAVVHAALLCVAHRTALAHAHTVAVAVIGHAGRAVFVRTEVEAVTGGNELVDVAVTASVGHKGIILHITAQALMGGVCIHIGLTGAAVGVLHITVVLADAAPQKVVILFLIGTLHALQNYHILTMHHLLV